jgi:hypothetical protein
MDATRPIYIPYLYGFDDTSTLEEISHVLNTYERRSIQHAPWSEGAKQPEASFALAYGNEDIYLKYYVKEHTLKAEYINFNDPVFEDSCVEFFIAFDDDASYYNLEFNCIGNCRVQYGLHKDDRAFIPVNLLKTIRHQTHITSKAAGNIHWELTLSIPKRIFTYHPGLFFEESKAKVNVFKCGDGLPEPHFLCWSEIDAPHPEFHLTKFFKQITFSRSAS